MLQWKILGFLLLITLQHTTVNSKPQSDSDSATTTKGTGPSSSTTISPGGAFDSKPASGSGGSFDSKPAGISGGPFDSKPGGSSGGPFDSKPAGISGGPFDSKPGSPSGFNPINGPKPAMPGLKPFPNNNDPKMSGLPMFPPLPQGCKTVSGTWYNEVGSRMVISQGPDNNLTGTFYTLRQSEAVDKKPLKANIVGGAAFIANSVMLGFTVSWGDNGYTTVWTGQCYSCGKEEIIETNWLMREPVKGCIDKWHSNRFGHSTFKKTKPVDIPDEDIADKDDIPAVPAYKKPAGSSTEGSNDTCSSIGGIWFNELGAKLDQEVKEDGTMQGIYDLPAMIKMAKSAQVTGISPYKEDGTFGFCSINEDGKVLTCWVGQCQKCKVNDTEIVMLDTYVANRLWVPTCLEEFRTTAYGGNRFTRQNYAPPMIPMHVGPIDHAGPMDHQGGPMDQGGPMNKPPNSSNNQDYPFDNNKPKPIPGMTETTTSSSSDKTTMKPLNSSDQ